jgi:hypothetical protein
MFGSATTIPRNRPAVTNGRAGKIQSDTSAPG